MEKVSVKFYLFIHFLSMLSIDVQKNFFSIHKLKKKHCRWNHCDFHRSTIQKYNGKWDFHGSDQYVKKIKHLWSRTKKLWSIGVSCILFLLLSLKEFVFTFLHLLESELPLFSHIKQQKILNPNNGRSYFPSPGKNRNTNSWSPSNRVSKNKKKQKKRECPKKKN